MQIDHAFGQVQGALSWFVDSYAELASWKASTDRLVLFQRRMQLARAESEQPDLLVRAESSTNLHATQLDLRLPGGKLLPRWWHRTAGRGSTS